MSWAAVLPQMLAALGARVFALAGVGKIVAHVTSVDSASTTPLRRGGRVLRRHGALHDGHGQRLRGVPGDDGRHRRAALVHAFRRQPAVMVAIGMLSGFCGTLMTPMAANFNIVPVALLELPDKNAVIKVQIPTALLLLAANTAIMYLFVFR